MKYCPECNEPVHCTSGTNETCWCSSLPPVLPVDDTQSCLCQKCLEKKLKAEIASYVQDFKAGRIENVAPKYATAELVEGIDYYMEGSYRVMTEWYHLKRGYCCRNGCRHCPYGFKTRTA